MDTIKMTGSNAKLERIQLLIAPIRRLWQQDKTYLLVFLVVIAAGQIGILASLVLSWQNGGTISTAWSQNLDSGAFYTFSISLVVSSLAMIGSEYIDANRHGTKIHFFELKTLWSLLACIVLLIQTPLVGALLSPPSPHFSGAKTAVTTIQSVTEPASLVTVPDAPSMHPKNEIQSRNEIRHSGQVISWIVSMIIALQLFCLHRIPHIPDSHAAHRNREVRELTEKAEHQKETAFDEKL